METPNSRKEVSLKVLEGRVQELNDENLIIKAENKVVVKINAYLEKQLSDCFIERGNILTDWRR